MSPPACCHGPQESQITYAPCAGGAAILVIGFQGPESRVQGDEHCEYAKSVWASRCWTSAEVPARGTQVTVAGSTWYVDASQYAAPCNLVLTLCRPLMDCPDCEADIYRITRGPVNLACLSPLEGTLLAGDVPATICLLERKMREENGAIIQVKKSRLCLDTNIDLLPGDMVFCTPDVYRITEITSTCSPRCMYTVIAEVDPYTVYEPA